MPSSRHSATAAGFCTSSESGPPSTTQPSNRSVQMTPPAAAPASSTRDADAAALQLVGGREARRCRRRRSATSRRRSVTRHGRSAMTPSDVLREHLHVLDRRRGQDAVAEIEDVARPAADRVAGSRRPAGTSAPVGPSSSVGSRLPWIARSWPIRSQASSMRDAPVDADDVAAGVAHVVEDRRRAGAEVDRRHARADRARRSAACGAARTRGSRPRSACRPTSRTPAPRPRPASICATQVVADDVGELARRGDARRPGGRTSAPWSCAKLFEWPPSIAYDASVNGAPAKPISGTRPSSSRWIWRDRVEHVRERLARLERPSADRCRRRRRSAARSAALRP